MGGSLEIFKILFFFNLWALRVPSSEKGSFGKKGLFREVQFWEILESRLSGTYRAICVGPTPLGPTPSEHLRPDLILTRKGRFQVQSRSKWRCLEVVGARGLGPAGMAL